MRLRGKVRRQCVVWNEQMSTLSHGGLWVILLAGGDGKRVRALTTTEAGVGVPKQFWKLDGQESMLGWALRRAAGIAPPSRFIPVVSEAHRFWWQRELSHLPPANVVVQPANRGTAPGVLLPLLRILSRDPEATVAVLPSDHFVANEGIIRVALLDALAVVNRHRSRVVLIGMKPQSVDVGFGWIMACRGSHGPVRKVSRFIEKPDRITALRLKRQGGLVNSLMLVACGAGLLRMFKKTVPALVDAFQEVQRNGTCDASEVCALYRHLPASDFSKEVLQSDPRGLWVAPVSNSGWNDLGTPMRLKSHQNSRISTHPVERVLGESPR